MRRFLLAFALIAATVPSMALATSSSLSPTAAKGTPQLVKQPGVQIVRQIVQCGDTMYAGGTFGEVQWNGKTYSRRNAFSFSASRPYTVTGWNPRPNGEVNTIAFANGDCSLAYVGGHFSAIGRKPAHNIAAVGTSGTGGLDTKFAHSAEAMVNNIQAHGSELLVGGAFNQINGLNRKYFASLNASTGRVDSYLNLHVSAHYVFNQQLSHSGRYDLVEASGLTRIDGVSRHQIAMLDLSGAHPTVTGWRSPGFSHPKCSLESFFVRAASWSPNDQTVYIATTGLRAGSGYPLTGLCDVAAALPAAHRSVKPKWVNYTGCDSLYSTAADSTTAYFGGHERWVNNKFGCNFKGKGAQDAQGIEGLSASSGSLVYNPGRSRGLGADDMLMTPEGLWVADDDESGSMCGHELNHNGICLLP